MSGQPKIGDYLQAGYPCLFMRTAEPHVAEREIRKAMIEMDMDDVAFGIWKISTGLMVGRPDETVKPQGVKDDLIDSLAVIEHAKKNEPIVGVFHNIRQMIANNAVIQQIIDSTMAARLKGCHLIFVGPHIDLPVELKNIVTVVDCPLPTSEEIARSYERLVEAYEDVMELPEDAEDRKELLREASIAAVGLDSLGAENALSLSMALHEEIDIRTIQRQKEDEVKKSDVLEFIDTDETMEHVGGFDVFKAWLTKRQKVFTEEAREYGLPYPKGMLIVGPAGSGKSLTAKASAGFLRLPLLRLDMGKVFRSLVGESEAAIRMALAVVEAVSPCVLWIDEIEKGMAGMSGSGNLDSGVTARVVSTILTWRQETTAPVVLVATANEIASIPSMVYRKGRLDEVWATDLPTSKEREEIFAIHIAKRDRDPAEYNLGLLARKTESYVGSEVEAVIEDAMFKGFADEIEFTTQHILEAIDETVPTAQRDKEELEAIRQWAKERARMVSSEHEKAVNGTARGKVRKIGTRKKTPSKSKK